MSREATKAAKRQRVADPTAKAILLLLADRHNAKTGECFPSIDLIARDDGVPRQMAASKLAFLKREDLIAREPRLRNDGTRSSNNYRLLFLEREESAAKPARRRKRKTAALPPDDWRPRQKTLDRIRERHPHHDTSDESIDRLIEYWIDNCHARGRRHRDFDRAWANHAKTYFSQQSAGSAPFPRRQGQRGGAGALSGALRRALAECES